jgi:hypothetical protein
LWSAFECFKTQHNGSNWTTQRYRTITSKKKKRERGSTARTSVDSKNTPIFSFKRRGTTAQTISVQDFLAVVPKHKTASVV